MRLRKIKNALERLLLDEKYFVPEPARFKGSWAKNAFNNSNQVEIEIGCGKGRFLVETALKHPEINYIGIEKYDSVLLRSSELARNYSIPNLKLVLYDAGNLLDLFNTGELALIYLNFSDPWIKKRQYKRRLTADSFLEVYKDILASDGAIYQKTDNRFLFAYSLEAFNRNGWDLSNITLNLHDDNWEENIMTEFEEKWSKLGPIYRLEARKRGANE